MGRENRIIAALAPTDVPVAPLVGAQPGRLRQRRPLLRHGVRRGPRDPGRGRGGRSSRPRPARRAGEQIVDVMARIHAVDVDAVGLGDLGRKEGYIARQLKRWYGQWEKSKTRELPAVDRVHDALLASVPEQGPAAIVHGDYRLDNCILGDDGARRRRARLGDLHARRPAGRPRPADGLLGRAGTTAFAALPGGATAVEGFPSRAELLDALRRRLGPGRQPGRLLRRLRLLEAGLHPRGRLRPLPRRGHGRRPTTAPGSCSPSRSRCWPTPPRPPSSA